MSKIKVLPSRVVSKIRAGEVITSPAAVVKELIENALDAHANTIKIHLVDGGTTLIKVVDTGQGISRTELGLALKQYATSKISTERDLESITTLGFRGEALSSIALASNLTLASRKPQQPTGFCITPTMNLPQPVGMPVGTQVMVESLFEDIPARKKFLKKPASELAAILKIIRHHALAHPRKTFYVVHNKTVVLDLPTQTLQERIAAITQTDLHEWLEIPQQNSVISVNGWMGIPQLAKTTQLHQYLFVNQRPVDNPTLTKVIKKTYGSLLPKEYQPAFVLYLTLAPELVDVNVHPQKKTISFIDETTITQLVAQTCADVLSRISITTQVIPQDMELDSPSDLLSETELAALKRTASQDTKSIFKKLFKPWELIESPEDSSILQINNTYLAVPLPTGLMLVDQHAAHERILYQEYMAALENSSQSRSIPELLIKCTSDEILALQEEQATLEKSGFRLTINQKQSVVSVSSVPLLIGEQDIPQLIKQIAQDLIEQVPISHFAELTNRTIAYLACRSAIKAGDAIDQDARRRLITKLSQTQNNTHCPHGRPTVEVLDEVKLERMFGR